MFVEQWVGQAATGLECGVVFVFNFFYFLKCIVIDKIALT